MPTVPEHAFAFHAVIKAGGEAVLLNNRLQVEEMEYLLDDARPAFILMNPRFRDTDFAAMLAEPIARRQHIRKVVTLGDTDLLPHVTWDVLREGGGEVSEEELRRREESDDEKRSVTVIYTSGTTGVPKGAMISARNIKSNLDAWNERLDVGENDVVGVFFPSSTPPAPSGACRAAPPSRPPWSWTTSVRPRCCATSTRRASPCSEAWRPWPPS